MGVFSTCTLCGKKKISLFIGSDGLCSACHAIMETLRETQTLSEKEPEPKEKIDVSDLLKQADPGYSPPPAPSDEPVYVFVDVETTGLKATEDAIVQVSALRFFGKKTIDGLNSYVNPLRPIPEKVVAIHGITDDKVKDAPTIDEIKEPFMNLIKDAILVGHNAPFDLDFLNHAFHGVLDGVEYIDTMEIAKAILNLPNYRLETVADYVEFHPEGN